MYKILLSDGIEINNLELNGNNFIPETEIDPAIFENNLEKITIMDEQDNITEMNNVKVIFSTVSGRQSFVLVEKTTEELEREKLYQLLADLAEVVLLGRED